MADDDVDPAPYPPYVVTEADKTRWVNAGRVARQMMGDDATSDELWTTRRMLFHNRADFPD
jgi:hypothetical protein